ncbi:MAG: exonuclease domain-containing protein [Candidatus Gracilibacteria bacterium]|jgi:DNA polymerase III epsilon subunit-like protein/Rad3-related DNA helicase
MFVCLDIETTGLNSKTDHIIEVAIVHFDKEKILSEWSTLVKPSVPIPAFTTHLTGITNEMVTAAPTLEEIMPKILEELGTHPIMGHYICFDVDFLKEKGAPINPVLLDTCALAESLLIKEPSYSLEVLTKKLGISQTNAHRALNDVKANIELFYRLSEHIKALTTAQKSRVTKLLKNSDWGWAQTFLEILKEDGGALIKTEKITKEEIEETHADLNTLTQNFTAPFLVEEGSHTDKDLLAYALSLSGHTLLVLPEVDTLLSNKDAEVLKHPNQYLDENRFETFLKKDRFNAEESVLGVKVLLWLGETTLGEKSEIKLLRGENEKWFEICGLEGEEIKHANASSGSFFARAQKAATEKKVKIISQIHFLKEFSKEIPALPPAENLIIGHAENLPETIEDAWHFKFTENRFSGDLRALNMPDLADRIAILFGLLGMFYQKNMDTDTGTNGSQLVIEQWHLNTDEWNKVKLSAEALNTEIAKIKSKTLQKTLSYMTLVLKTGAPLLWISLTEDGTPVLHAFPQNFKEILTERVWRIAPPARIFCHHAEMGDDFSFLKTELALPPTVSSVTLQEVFPLPLELPDKRLPVPNDPKNIPLVAHELVQRLSGIDAVTGNVFLFVTSKANAEQFFYRLADPIKKLGRKLFVQNMSGGMGKIVKMAMENENENPGLNFFVGTEDLMFMLLKEGLPLSFLAIHRIPFSNPTDPIKACRAKNYTDPYKEFTIPYASLRFRQIVDAFLGNKWTGKRILQLDSRISAYENKFY